MMHSIALSVSPLPGDHRRNLAGLRKSHTARGARRQLICFASGDGTRETPKVVCIGEALFDCLADQIGVPREEVKSWTPYPGGAPLNVATAAAKLGVPAAAVTAIGNDKLGDDLLALMERRGVNTAGVQRIKKPTRDVLVVRKANGDRVFAGFGRATSEYSDCFIEAAAIPDGLIGNADVLVLGTLGLAQPVTREGIKGAVSMAKDGNTLVVVDVNWRPVFWEDPSSAVPVIEPVLAQADVVKLTDEEAEWLLGIPSSQALQDPSRVEKALAESGVGGLRGVLVTAGEGGASYSFNGVSGFQPVYDIDVKDTTGAGDAFTAGFVAELIRAGVGGGTFDVTADQLRRALAFAAACGALTCTRPGAIDAQPTADEVEALVTSAKTA